MTDGDENAPVQRLDKWLWFSRVLKSRTQAAQLVAEGKVRVNRVRITKPSHSVRAGDVITVAVRGRVLVVRILAPGARRGPASEARLLYAVLSGTDRAALAQAPPEERGTGKNQH
jgi:ribosome-associated heat shock protein Hsp15